MKERASMASQLATSATTLSTIPSRPSTLESIFDPMRRRHARIRQLLSVWRSRSRDRAALRSLSPQAIHDFCPRQTEAEMEMNKPFWRE
jgi:uncharacterized protein YjiS (DUF1127 family)